MKKTVLAKDLIWVENGAKKFSRNVELFKSLSEKTKKKIFKDWCDYIKECSKNIDLYAHGLNELANEMYEEEHPTPDGQEPDWDAMEKYVDEKEEALRQMWYEDRTCDYEQDLDYWFETAIMCIVLDYYGNNVCFINPEQELPTSCLFEHTTSYYLDSDYEYKVD